MSGKVREGGWEGHGYNRSQPIVQVNYNCIINLVCEVGGSGW